MIIGEIQAPWLSSPSASPWRMPMRCGTPIGRGMPGREARDFSIEDEDFTSKNMGKPARVVSFARFFSDLT